MRWRFVAALLASGGVAILALSGAGTLARREYDRTMRARHAARGETELRVVNPAEAFLSLHRACATLEDVEDVPLPTGERRRSAGRYFVAAAAGSWRQLFPVSLEPSVAAPEADSLWTLTVRRPIAEGPPRLHERAPSFVFVPGGYPRGYDDRALDGCGMELEVAGRALSGDGTARAARSPTRASAATSCRSCW